MYHNKTIKQHIVMIITSIKYNKIISVITENTDTKQGTVASYKVSELESVLKSLECFSMTLNKTVLKKTVKKIEALGFEIIEDSEWGFDWETKLICTI